MLSEKVIKGFPGWLILVVLLAAVAATVRGLVVAIQAEATVWIVSSIVLLVVEGICFGGFTVVNPNEAKVVQLFGVYRGSIKEQGFYWVNPLTSRRTVSLRVRNFESS